MEHYAGIDVSLECSSVCVVDASGKIVGEGKVVSEPEALVQYFRSHGVSVARIGLEAGPCAGGGTSQPSDDRARVAGGARGAVG
jgi:hypothetical protein